MRKILVVYFSLVFVMLLFPYIYFENYFPTDMDSIFHLTEIERFKNHENVNAEITAEIPRTAFVPAHNYTWHIKYVSSYPKAYHQLASLIPLNAKLSMGISNAFWYTTMLLGIFLFAYTLSGSAKNSLTAVNLYIIVGNLSGIFYNYNMINMAFPHVMFCAILMLTLATIVFGVRNRLLLLIVPIGLAVVLLLFTHNISYTPTQYLDMWLRELPMATMIFFPILSKIKLPKELEEILMFSSMALSFICLHHVIFNNSYFYNMDTSSLLT